MLRHRVSTLLCPAIVGLAAAPAFAGPTVASFLDRANPIREQGFLGMLSPEVPQLRAEAKAAIAQMKAERQARVRAGKSPLYCKPADEPDPGVEEVIDALNDLPPRQQRTLSLKDGIVRVMADFYPCR